MDLLAHVTSTEFPLGVVFFVTGVVVGILLAGTYQWIGNRNK